MPTLSTTAKVIGLDPISRVEGHLRVQVTVDTVQGRQQVVDAKLGGTLFRGFEKILVARNPLDAPDVSMRICGVCPVSQGLAATLALETAAGTIIPNNARVMRNLVLAADHLHSHIMHFYVLSAVDFVDGPNMPPWQPSWSTDKRITGAAATGIVNNYVKALDYRRKAHEMGALFGGRLPHPPTYVPGGFTATPRPERITAFRNYLNDLTSFVENVYLPDVQQVANIYADYYQLGAGPKNMLAYGVFDLDSAGASKLLKRGVALNASRTASTFDQAKVTEAVTYSWYANGDGTKNPAASSTTPTNPKNGAYSWLKAPRYNGAACEVGPLARMWVNGDYQSGISVMDRHAARAWEARKIVHALNSWLNELVSTGPVYQTYTTPSAASGIGLTEAARGALGHWVSISKGAVSNYQIVSPTCWNASPRDNANVPGPIEQALIGLPVQNIAEPVEVIRTIHSFDPCLGCAVHVMRPGEQGRVFST